jgi:hypothetical protein
MDTSTETYYINRIARLEELNTALQNAFDGREDSAHDAKEAELAQSLDSATARADRYIESYNTVSITHINKVEAMREWTLENLSDETISEGSAEEIAEIMGFELTQEFEATVTVEYNIMINARDKESAQEHVDMIDFESVNYDSDAISYLSATVEHTYF